MRVEEDEEDLWECTQWVATDGTWRREEEGEEWEDGGLEEEEENK